MCGITTTTLAANAPEEGTGFWSIESGTGGSITNVNNPTSTFTGIAERLMSYAGQSAILRVPHHTMMLQ